MGAESKPESAVDDFRAAVRDLQERLNNKKLQVEEWCAKQHEDIRNSEDVAMERIEEMKKKIRQLAEEHKQLVSLGYTNGIRLDAERKRVLNLQNELDGLRENEAGITKEMDTVLGTRNDLSEKSSATQREIEEEQQKKEYQVNMLTRGAKLYKKLGLEFERASQNRLKLSFTNIDPSDWDRSFHILIFLDESDQYHVEQVQPNIGDINPYVDELNKTNDFSKFVRTIRGKFQSLCGCGN